MPSVVPEAQAEGRLLLVSNRLPITINRSEDGHYDFSMSSGGLVSGLSGLSKSTTFQWYGWPGLEVPENEAANLTQRLKDEYGAVPVMLDDELADRHYNGFSSMIYALSSWYRLLTAFAQTQSSGHSSTTILVKSPSMNQPGRLTVKRIACSPKLWLRMSTTAI